MSIYRAMLFCSLCLLVGIASSTEEVLRIGSSTALTGPTKALGLGMIRGMSAHFNEINLAGGIHKRKIEFIALDDGYDPKSAQKQMRSLVHERNVLAVVGNVGTPTAKVTVPIAIKNKVPLVGVLSGAGLLRKNPPDKQVFNYRASYAEEMRAIIHSILSNGINPFEIAFFTQNDSFGDAGYRGGVDALKSMGIKEFNSIVHARYPRNTLHIKTALVEIVTAEHEPKAIVIIGTYGPAAKFIRQAQKLLPDTLFFNISFVGSHALANALNGCCSKVFVSQVVPPFDAKLEAVEKYKQAIILYDESGVLDDISFEGYLVASMLTEAMKRAGKDVTRDKLLTAFENMNNLDLGVGKNLHFSETQHQASHQVWLTSVKGKKVVSSDWDSLN